MLAHAFLQVGEPFQVLDFAGGAFAAHARVPAVEGEGEPDDAAALEAGGGEGVVGGVVGEEGGVVEGVGGGGGAGVEGEGGGAEGEAGCGVDFWEVDLCD